MATTKSRNWRGSCTAAQAAPADTSEAHTSWDLDIGDVRSWLRAQRICTEECPLLAACLRQRQSYPTSNPRSVIWAGVAYSELGRVLDTAGLRRLHAVQRNRHMRGKPSRPLLAETA